MPKESTTPIGRGPGSNTPSFTSPKVTVATPGLGATAAPTEAEKFRDAILSFGQGLAGAVSGLAQIDARINSLKERAVAKVERDLSRSARSFQTRRLETSDQKRRALFAEAQNGDISMEALERDLRSRMANSSSAQEGALWEKAWRVAAGQVSRENKQSKEQAFNRAKIAMSEVAMGFQADLVDNPEQADGLIGDGTNIGSRVQKRMLETLRENTDLGALDPDDAELLIHQAVVQSARISDGLREVHQKRVVDANNKAGSRQLEADFFSTLTGEQEVHNLREQIEVTVRDRFSHLTPEQQTNRVRSEIVSGLEKLATGAFGLENMDLQQAAELLDMSFDGQKVFNPAERAQLEAAMFESAERVVSDNLEARLTEAREGFSSVVQLPDGTQVTVPALDADALLIAKDERGVSGLDIIASRLLDEMVPEDQRGTAAGQRLIGVIRAQQAQMQGRISSGATQWQAKTFQSQSFYAGGTAVSAEDANTAYDYSPEARVLRKGHELAAQANRAPAKAEIDHLREQYTRIARSMGVDDSVVQEWGGGQIGTDEVKLRAIAEAHHANLHNGVQQMPRAAVREKLALLTSDDTNDLRAFTSFLNALDGGPEGAYQRFLNADALDDQQRAAVIHIRKTMKLGLVSFSADGDPIFQTPDSEGVDFERLRAVAQQIRNAPQQRDWLFNQAVGLDKEGDEFPRGTTNVELIATSMAEALMSSRDPALYGNTNWQIEKDRVNQAMIVALTNNSGLSQFVNATAQSQSALQAGLDHDGMAAVISGWMQRAGMRFKQTNGTFQLLQDPFNYAGEPGQDIDAHANEVLTRSFQPWYREVIAQAMGIPVGEAPANIQGIFLHGRQGEAHSALLGDTLRDLTAVERAAPNTQFSAFHGSSFADNQLRLLSIEDGGGSPVYIQTLTGPLAVPTAVTDVLHTRPDGTVFSITAGQALNVYNSAQFVPQARRETRGANGIQPRATARTMDYVQVRNIPQP